MQVGIIDSGISNLGSVVRWIKYANGFEPQIISSYADIKHADLIVFPGVGAFDTCVDNLTHKDILEGIIEHTQKGKKYLGICLGFQLLFKSSAEGTLPGMNIFDSKIEKLDSNIKISLPHVGFNDITCIGQSGFSSLDQASFYFTHSYGLIDNIDEYKNLYSTTNNAGVEFVSMIQHDNVLGCQFHPEKSSAVGIKFLELTLQWSKKD